MALGPDDVLVNGWDPRRFRIRLPRIDVVVGDRRLHNLCFDTGASGTRIYAAKFERIVNS